ncbi:MAG: hypothetical protein WCH75_17745 [Candidatus Binatia bacterium]
MTTPDDFSTYAERKAAYDLRKLRGKSLVERIGKTWRYRMRRPGIRTMPALLILREQVINRYWPGSVGPNEVVRLTICIRSISIIKNSNVKCWRHSKP